MGHHRDARGGGGGMRRAEYPRFTAYVTKYALTQGILCVQGYLTESGDALLCYDEKGAMNHTSHAHGEGREWHRTFEGARDRAKEMVSNKRSSIARQLRKLDRLTFHLSAVVTVNPCDDA